MEYVSGVTNINRTVIINNINNNTDNITRINNVVPSQQVVARDTYIRQIVPPALLQGQPLPPPKPAANVGLARANLGKPDILPAPQGVPQVPAQIPRVQPQPVAPGQGVLGAGLPAKAVMPLTPQMQQLVQKLPPKQQIVPIKPLPIQPVATQPTGAPAQPPAPALPAAPAKPAVPALPAALAKPASPAEPAVKGIPAAPSQPAVPAKPPPPAQQPQQQQQKEKPKPERP